jgi:hypothetical protein
VKITGLKIRKNPLAEEVKDEDREDVEIRAEDIQVVEAADFRDPYL